MITFDDFNNAYEKERQSKKQFILSTLRDGLFGKNLYDFLRNHSTKESLSI